jgi:hypothetical protein
MARPVGPDSLRAGGRAVVAAETPAPIPRHANQRSGGGIHPQHQIVVAQREEHVARPVGRDSVDATHAGGCRRDVFGQGAARKSLHAVSLGYGRAGITKVSSVRNLQTHRTPSSKE